MTLKPRTLFARLLVDCGFSPRGYSNLTGVKYTTVRNWIWGTAKAPDDAIAQLTVFRAIVRQHFPHRLD